MTAPVSLYLQNAGPAQPFEVRVGDTAGDPPTKDQVSDIYQVISVTRAAGGHRLDHCELYYDLAAAQQRIMDLQTPSDISVKVQVHALSPFFSGSAGCVFSGEMGLGSIRIDRQEVMHLTARVEQWHFGDPLLGPHTLDLDNTTIQIPNQEIVFQPQIDGRVEDNMLVTVGSPTASYDNYALWIDPEAVRTTTATNAKGQTASPWTLARAVHSLCWACNPNQDFIVNPTLSELQTIFTPNDPATERAAEDLVDTGSGELVANGKQATETGNPSPNEPPELRNIRLPRGKTLPEYLDLLLPRFGYSWFVEPVSEQPLSSGVPNESADPIVRNHIRIFRLGAGSAVALYLQRPTNPPASLVVGQSNVPQLAAEWNWADVANQVTGQGSAVEWEATFELYRAWPEADDALTVDQLRRVDDGSDTTDEETQFKTKPNVWRKWVLNEAGDYCGTRATVGPIPSTPFDLKPLLGPNTQAKRRRFHHCLTHNAEGERREVYLQYRDPTVPGDSDPGAWKSIPRDGGEAWTNCQFHVLHKECGIYFSGEMPPGDLVDLGNNARLRITAAIRGDDRIEYTAVRQGTCPNRNNITIFVDLSDRFHYRDVLVADIPGSGGGPTIYASALQAEPYGDDTVNDEKLLKEFCDGLRSIEQPARVSCDFELAGIQTAYEIGQLISEIDGRDISFNRNAPDNSEKLYPQITQIVYDRAKQRTRLTVETYEFAATKLKGLMF